MLALLSNCLGHLSMSRLMGRFWTRGHQHNNGKGKGNGVVEDEEFVRVEGRGKARPKLDQKECSLDGHCPSPGLPPLIRIEKSESSENQRRPVEVEVVGEGNGGAVNGESEEKASRQSSEKTNTEMVEKVGSEI